MSINNSIFKAEQQVLSNVTAYHQGTLTSAEFFQTNPYESIFSLKENLLSNKLSGKILLTKSEQNKINSLKQRVDEVAKTAIKEGSQEKSKSLHHYQEGKKEFIKKLNSYLEKLENHHTKLVKGEAKIQHLEKWNSLEEDLSFRDQEDAPMTSNHSELALYKQGVTQALKDKCSQAASLLLGTGMDYMIENALLFEAEQVKTWDMQEKKSLCQNQQEHKQHLLYKKELKKALQSEHLAKSADQILRNRIECLTKDTKLFQSFSAKIDVASERLAHRCTVVKEAAKQLQLESDTKKSVDTKPSFARNAIQAIGAVALYASVALGVMIVFSKPSQLSQGRFSSL
ncbi:MAG: hypothetical protein Q8L98_03305 [Chlamydiales bacterium]|nr:hypothetical protein [Chlamydiales bacterium]